MVPVLLFPLLFLGPAVAQETQDGLYSLTYYSIGISRPNEGFPSFQATGYLNDQAFLHYDSESEKAEPLGPWKHVKGMVDWEEVSKTQKARGDFFLKNLKDIMDLYKDTGNHTMQEKYGCKIRNNNYCGAFWTIAYDGQDYIKFDTEIPAWIPLQPKALNTKVKWETEGSVWRAKSSLEEECTQKLQKYLQYSRTFLDRQDPPSVSVTSHGDLGHIRILRCLAYNFYPRPISVYWTQAGNVVETESWGEGSLSENGTYQAWVVIKIPSSDRGPYSCHVQHSSLAQPLAVLWNERQ
ncbi:zinc-alpha-2-glycoprotein [Molossus molossus]|uniref:Alpha-2-glycoprotein 1, zinc-binding n=1 Tax=Molossus molossus TaxID=27622 RepID=A0A7J8IY04_MOLMO|nr:zinc-alpha-2-glycoprotein [Molossus molossus]XP_036136418.1 zinc-alpha-2-glycoprotein [Molossus molossus]KAF6488792.1 alpha-2-glycoprotein 1, zinc-binding [Molossus molossus]